MLLIRHQRYVALEVDHAHAGIQQQVAITAAHMPHTAAYIGNDMRLKDQCNIATISAGLEPRFDDGQRHGRNLT